MTWSHPAPSRKRPPLGRGPLPPQPERRWRRWLGWLFRPESLIGLLLIGLLGLPAVMLSALSRATLAQMTLQANEISTLASSIRAYYADNVISRLQEADGKAVFSENYRSIHGGIPIPATLSIELGALFDNAHTDGRIAYEFISDYPFAKRKSRPLDSFEGTALTAFRNNPELPSFSAVEDGIGRSVYRLATPVIMRQACVTCHNSHPDSPKKDWKVGDVRGIQEVTVRGVDVEGFGNLGLLMGYSGLLAIVSFGAATVFQRQSRQLSRINSRLQEANERESTLSQQLSNQLEELSLLGAVVDTATFGVSIADMRQPDTPLIYVNEAFCRITGYSRDKATGYNCRFLRGPDTDPATCKAIAEAIRSGGSFSGELINYRLDGTRFWNRLTLYPIGGSSGKPDFYVGNQVDITASKEAALRQSRELASLQYPLNSAAHTVDDALQFSRALEEKLRARELLTVDLEAFFRSEHQALRQLKDDLAAATALIQPDVEAAANRQAAEEPRP